MMVMFTAIVMMNMTIDDEDDNYGKYVNIVVDADYQSASVPYSRQQNCWRYICMIQPTKKIHKKKLNQMEEGGALVFKGTVA